MSRHIPWDVCREILVCLPSKSVLRFRAVCKTWLSIVDEPCFERAHTNKQLSSNTTTILIRNSTGPPYFPLYTVDLETLNPIDGHHNVPATPLEFTRSGLSRLTDLSEVATCNGLMLVAPKDPAAAQNWEMWNPLTHERLDLPRRKFNKWIDAFGIGYDSANDDYKAVVVDCKTSYWDAREHLRLRRLGSEPTAETHVYSLKSDCWRKIMDYPRGKWADWRQGVFLRGALHWMAKPMFGEEVDDYDKIIIALDLGTESYREMKMPPFRKLNEFDCNKMPVQCQSLDVLDGCLVVSDSGEDGYFALWVSNVNGAENSWTKVFTRNYISPRTCFLLSRPIAFLSKKKSTQVFMQLENADGGFGLLDLETGSAKTISIHCLCGGLSAQVFHGTIFRLHDNCGVSAAGRRRKRKITSKSKIKMVAANTELKFCVRGPTSDSHYCCT